MDWLQQMTSGRYRIPDLTKLWKSGADGVDGAKKVDTRTIFQRLEPNLVKIQVS